MYIICADSDDIKTPNMLEVYNYYWEQLEKSDDYFKFWEIKTRCSDEYGLLVGSNWENEILDYILPIGYKNNKFDVSVIKMELTNVTDHLPIKCEINSI